MNTSLNTYMKIVDAFRINSSTRASPPPPTDYSEKKRESRKVVFGLSLALIIALSGVLGSVVYYNSIISEKDSRITDVSNQLQQKTDQASNLQLWLNGNLSQISDLNLQISTLNSQISSLTSEISNLKDELETANSEISQKTNQISTLNSQISNINSQLSTLQSEKTSLSSQVSSLNSQLSSLQTTYNNYVTSYQNMRNQINARSQWTNRSSFITYQDSALISRVNTITGGWSNTADWNEYWADVKAMYDWVYSNIEYRSDGLVPILPSNPSSAVEYFDEMWQFPNETLALGQGDCEDIAILLCSMIEGYGGGKYTVECIGFESSQTGHLAVQLRLVNDKLVILDPAGDYYTTDGGGTIATSKSVSSEINNWLNHWMPQAGPDIHIRMVFSETAEEDFTSTNQYVSWILGN